MLRRRGAARGARCSTSSCRTPSRCPRAPRRPFAIQHGALPADGEPRRAAAARADRRRRALGRRRVAAVPRLSRRAARATCRCCCSSPRGRPASRARSRSRRCWPRAAPTSGCGPRALSGEASARLVRATCRARTTRSAAPAHRHRRQPVLPARAGRSAARGAAPASCSTPRRAVSSRRSAHASPASPIRARARGRGVDRRRRRAAAARGEHRRARRTRGRRRGGRPPRGARSSTRGAGSTSCIRSSAAPVHEQLDGGGALGRPRRAARLLAPRTPPRSAWRRICSTPSRAARNGRASGCARRRARRCRAAPRTPRSPTCAARSRSRRRPTPPAVLLELGLAEALTLDLEPAIEHLRRGVETTKRHRGAAVRGADAGRRWSGSTTRRTAVAIVERALAASPDARPRPRRAHPRRTCSASPASALGARRATAQRAARLAAARRGRRARRRDGAHGRAPPRRRWRAAPRSRRGARRARDRSAAGRPARSRSCSAMAVRCLDRSPTACADAERILGDALDDARRRHANYRIGPAAGLALRRALPGGRARGRGGRRGGRARRSTAPAGRMGVLLATAWLVQALTEQGELEAAEAALKPSARTAHRRHRRRLHRAAGPARPRAAAPRAGRRERGARGPARVRARAGADGRAQPGDAGLALTGGPRARQARSGRTSALALARRSSSSPAAFGAAARDRDRAARPRRRRRRSRASCRRPPTRWPARRPGSSTPARSPTSASRCGTAAASSRRASRCARRSIWPTAAARAPLAELRPHRAADRRRAPAADRSSPASRADHQRAARRGDGGRRDCRTARSPRRCSSATRRSRSTSAPPTRSSASARRGELAAALAAKE